MPSHVIISIDLDMWWHCRWATGSKNALWPDCQTLFKEHFKTEHPGEGLETYTEEILKLLNHHNIIATFFILGEVAKLHPDLVRKVSAQGHEIACHGFHHVDATDLSRKEFIAQVNRAKTLLEDITGTAVTGYRAPNLILTPWLFEAVSEIGFTYDSSLCPARKFRGKYGQYTNAPNHPFRLGNNFFISPPPKTLIEIPIPTMPFIKLPVGSGIFTRLLGVMWAKIGLHLRLLQGDTGYYFHPYELIERKDIGIDSSYVDLFFRNSGNRFKHMLEHMLSMAVKQGTITAAEAASKTNIITWEPDIS